MMCKHNSSLTDMDEHPKLHELRCFGNNHTDIIAKIGQSYQKFGVLILEDAGEKMEPLESECQGNAEQINAKVLTRWVKGDGKKPTSWATLATVLDECKLTKLADEIRSVKGKSVQFSS